MEIYGMLNSAENEANKIMKLIREFWGSNVSEIKVKDLIENPFEMFALTMKLYNKYEVIMEYDRETLGIKVKNQDQFLALSRITDKNIYRGFDSYYPDNMLHNFKVLDETLQKMSK